MPRFGPPRACSARFSLATGRSPGFGSTRDDSTPFRTRLRSGSACPWLSLAAAWHSSAHSTKGTPSPPRRRAPTGRGRTVSGLFHSPRRGAFHRSLTVLVHCRSSAVFSLGPWSAPLPAGFRVSGGTHATTAPRPPTRRLRGSHPLRRPVPAAFGCAGDPGAAPLPRGPRRPSNPAAASAAACAAATVWAPPRSLAATGGILSSPRGTEMFQFPRCPPRPCGRGARPCAGRVAPFGHPRIPGCQRLPGAFRRVAASFVGRRRQGIHRAPFLAATPRRAPGAGPAGPPPALAGAKRPPGPRRPPRPGGGAPGPRPRVPRSFVPREKCGAVRAGAGGPLRGRPPPRPRGLGGPARLVVKVPAATRRRARVEPRGFEPRASAVQGRRSPG